MLITAKYFNDTTILCASPGGWGDVEAVSVDATFNGVDYTPNSQTFRYFNIINAFPRSGPSDGSGQIKVTGLGFKNEKKIKCKMDGVAYDATSNKWDEIICSIPKARLGPSFFGNVPFEVSINGDDWHSFPGGFQYYEQPLVEKIYPA
ncbi:MAG: IPT/TIG domain-containing protein [Streptococcus sp.]|nr:IPT/TIG domain-containing protein [Streptococcus sp.]